jgi:hypothetical protein
METRPASDVAQLPQNRAHSSKSPLMKEKNDRAKHQRTGRRSWR